MTNNTIDIGGNKMKERPLHISHPNGTPHPFKGGTLCGKMVRFGGFETENKVATCKICLKIKDTLCPTCHGTGTK
jgi:hypothetical protein